LSIDKSLTIIGQGRVTISGGGTVRVIRVGLNVTLNLDGMTIANGLAARGGGINNFGTLTVTNSTFSGNRTTGFNAGGAIFNGLTLTVTNSTFSGNSAEEGGGIGNYGTATVTNSTFSGNSATVGGAIFNGFTLTVTNSTFSGNSATSGGGIYNYRNITITNSTFSGNSATSGGGIYNSGRFNLTNSIVALNTAPRGPELNETINDATVVTLSHNLIGNPDGGSGITDGVNDNIVNDDPKLGTLADNGGPTQTLALLAVVQPSTGPTAIAAPPGTSAA
jgi:predicted outer membrane repeat protein